MTPLLLFTYKVHFVSSGYNLGTNSSFIITKTDKHTSTSISVKPLSPFSMLNGVVSFFTNLVIKEALQMIGRCLKEDKTLASLTKLTLEDIMDLLEFVLPTTYFMFDGNIYKQIQGAPMGNPVLVVVSNLYMADHEMSIQSAPLEMKPKIRKRYVDDSFEIVKGQRDPFTVHFNSSQ